MKPSCWRLIATILLGGILAAAISIKVKAAEASDTWITGGARSYHGNRSVPHNEYNLGLGWEKYLTPDLRAGIAIVDNSFWKPSLQVYVMYTPYSLGAVKFGVTAGGVTGYGRVIEPVVLPVATWEHGVFGVDVVAFPPISTFDGFAAVRFKFKANWEGQ